MHRHVLGPDPSSYPREIEVLEAVLDFELVWISASYTGAQLDMPYPIHAFLTVELETLLAVCIYHVTEFCGKIEEAEGLVGASRYVFLGGLGLLRGH